MKLELRHKYDLEIMRMSYDDFIQWRDSGYIEFLYQGLISHSLTTVAIEMFSIDRDADYESLKKFINKEYDYLRAFLDIFKHTLRAVCRYAIVECNIDGYEAWNRDKNIDTILD